MIVPILGCYGKTSEVLVAVTGLRQYKLKLWAGQGLPTYKLRLTSNDICKFILTQTTPTIFQNGQMATWKINHFLAYQLLYAL